MRAKHTTTKNNSARRPKLDNLKIGDTLTLKKLLKVVIHIKATVKLADKNRLVVPSGEPRLDGLLSNALDSTALDGNPSRTTKCLTVILRVGQPNGSQQLTLQLF